MENDRDTLTRQLVDDLSYSYRGVFDADQIETAVNGAWEAPLTTTDRPAFLDGDAGGHLFIRFESDFGGTASFADVDALTVRLSDL